MSRSFIFAMLLIMSSCRAGEPGDRPAGVIASPPAAVSRPADTQSKSFAPDAGYFQFGLTFKAEPQPQLDRTNPHQVASHVVFFCQSGATERLLKEFNHVEEDAKLGASFRTFIREFGPGLETFKGSPLGLKFEGYQDGKETSVWYYYLVSPDGKNLEHQPWVSLHRSKRNGRCALTGIFLNADGEEPAEMPTAIKKS